MFNDGISESVQSILQTLRDESSSLAVAESCTGGLLGGAITSVPGSSDVFKGGMITYSNELKRRLLDVDKTTLDQHGAVSEQVAEEMARGCIRRLESDYALAITGIAGPEGGTDEKPVGLVHFGYAGPENIIADREVFDGKRSEVRLKSVRKALSFLE